MDVNQMTESVGELSNIESIVGNNSIENVSKLLFNSQNNEKASLQNEGQNQALNQSEVVAEKAGNLPSKLEAEKGMELMISGTDEEITEYFGKQGIQTDEILKERSVFLNQVKEKMFQDDLNTLQKEFSFLTASKIQEIPNFDKFAKLRASGLSAIESFEGASGKLISMEYLKNRDEFSYSHLKSTGLKGSVSGGIPIPKDEVAIWKSAFPNDTFTQLTKRYNKTKFN